MKKLTLLLLALIFTIQLFGQNEDKKPKTNIGYSITDFYHKNIVFRDTVQFLVDKPWQSFADAVFKDVKYTIDSIPEKSRIIINGIHFENKKILSKVNDYQVLLVKKDSLQKYVFDENKKRFVNTKKYEYSPSMVYQEHPNLPRSFFFFKQNTLEPIRYSCSSYSPVLDVFNTADSLIISAKPRVMLDGRLQAREFDYQSVKLENIKSIDVFAKEDAINYFGQKAKSGLVSIVTKNSDFNLNWTLSNTHVVGEIQDKTGNWTIIKDTLLTNINEFKEFRKSVYATNGPVYLINGEFENEQVNRKTIDTDAIEAIEIVSGVRLRIKSSYLENKQNDPKYTNDTVRIKTQKERWTSKANVGIPSIMSQIKRLRNTDPEPTPIYIVDNQEITADKLKEFKNKDLEFIQSLEGCDAITKYGKRAEFGVVIYRKR
ncbi:MAG: hypothetical protein U5N85_01585 [Arcicella sp.]|nr:hypothetical protein [Arcicella sp.]